MSQKVLKVHPSDNIIVALQDIARGENITYDGRTYTTVDDVQAKHKFFAEDIVGGEEMIIYGVFIGTTQQFLTAGSLITTANVKHNTGKYAYRKVSYQWTPPDVSKFSTRRFNGYHRKNAKGHADFVYHRTRHPNWQPGLPYNKGGYQFGVGAPNAGYNRH